MLIKQNRNSDPLPSEITSNSVFLNRRTLLRNAAVTGIIAGIGPLALSGPALGRQKLSNKIIKTRWTQASLSKDETVTPYDDVTSYTNFYEFGTNKSSATENAHTLKPRPWTVIVDGHVESPGRYDFDDLVRSHDLEERVYRFRCVEAWSMVIPWVGIPLAKIIKRLGPTQSAKYLAFETLLDPIQMPGQNSPVLHWPYREGLRMDEATNPLTIMAVGIFGESLPNQNGAPIRLVTPWKYGFKSIKSIVRLSFTETQPPTSWNIAAPREYGFHANVNPTVSHPRWSQARERRLGGATNIFGFTRKQPTLMFNGYSEEVASMYSGMDLAKNY